MPAPQVSMSRPCSFLRLCQGPSVVFPTHLSLVASRIWNLNSGHIEALARRCIAASTSPAFSVANLEVSWRNDPLGCIVGIADLCRSCSRDGVRGNAGALPPTGAIPVRLNLGNADHTAEEGKILRFLERRPSSMS